jgi:glycosyltransferase involved in cell wall biosynthesis
MHLGIDTTVFRPGAAAHPALDSLERPLIFHPARLLAWKGILDSADAFIRIRRRIGSGSLLLVASESVLAEPEAVRAVRADVECRFERAEMPEALVLRDFTRSEMPAAYASADVVWYPTRDEEPFGLVPLEAMACGRVVVTTSSGGMRETIVDGSGALVVAPGDVDALTEKTLVLLREPARKESMELDAVRQVAPRSLSAYLDRLRRVYRGES